MLIAVPPSGTHSTIETSESSQIGLRMILVTGATGGNGKELIKQLERLGVPTRAMARKSPTSAWAPPSNVQYVVGDFDNRDSLARALEGVERAFLTTNSSELVEEQQLRFVEVAKQSGVRHVVYLSQLHADRNSPVRFLRYHAVVEKALADSRMAFTHLRPNLYMQALLGFAPSIQSDGRFFALAGNAPVSLVDVRDIAALAALALTQEGHEGKSYDVTGPEALTHHEIAAQMSEAIGRQVHYIDVPDAAMRESLLSYGMPGWQADGLVEDYAHYRRGEAAELSGDVQKVTGHVPRSFKSFLTDYGPAFSQNSLSPVA